MTNNLSLIQSTSIYCKIRLVANLVHDELTTREDTIHHNKLILQWEDNVAVTVYCLRH